MLFQRIAAAREDDPHAGKRLRLAEAIVSLNEAGYYRGRGRGGRRPAEPAGYPIRETDVVRVTEENVPHPYHGHAGGTIYYHVAVLSDRGASRGGWFKLKTYRDKTKALAAADFIESRLGLWQAMHGAKQFLAMDQAAFLEHQDALYGIMVKSSPKLADFSKDEVMREAQRWVAQRGRPPKRPFIKADDLPESVVVEADARLRLLQRAAASGDNDAALQYLRELYRSGQAPDLQAIPSDPSRFITLLWKEKAIDNLFNKHYPFDEPRAVLFLADVMDRVRDKRIQGVPWASFVRFVRDWLRKNNEQPDHRDEANAARFIADTGAGNEDEWLSEEGWGYVARHDSLWFPDELRDVQNNDLTAGALLVLADNMNGGAVVRRSEYGGADAELYERPDQRDGDWADVEQEYGQMQTDRRNEVIGDYARQMGLDYEVVERAMADYDEYYEEWRDADVEAQVSELLDDIANDAADHYQAAVAEWMDVPSNDHLHGELRTAFRAALGLYSTRTTRAGALDPSVPPHQWKYRDDVLDALERQGLGPE